MFNYLFKHCTYRLFSELVRFDLFHGKILPMLFMFVPQYTYMQQKLNPQIHRPACSFPAVWPMQ